LVTLALLGLLGAACSSARSDAPVTTSVSTSPSASSAPTPHTYSIVALGDSVPHGSNCGCTPYPQLSGDDLAASHDRTVTVANDAVGGYTTSDVLAQLQSDSTVIGRVRTSDVVEIEVGANDVGYSGSCGTSVACYEPTIPVVERNLAAIVARVHELTTGHPMLVVLLDYWSVWLGGQYAAAKGDAYVTAAAEVTDQVNTVIASTASATGAAYVDLRTAFKGPDHAYDETHYLAPDGDHPNAAGHEQIAAATVTQIETMLHL
jgi:lysophospholipase L1-like esterase